jgi:hypothetical protein
MKTSPLNFAFAKDETLTTLIRNQGFHFDRKARIVGNKDNSWASCYYCKGRMTLKNFGTLFFNAGAGVFICRNYLCRFDMINDDAWEDYRQMIEEMEI